MFDTLILRFAVWDLSTFCGQIAEDVVSPNGALLLPKGVDFSRMDPLNRRAVAASLANQGVARVAVQERAERSLGEIMDLFRQGKRPADPGERALFEDTLQFVESFCKNVIFGAPGNIHVLPLLRIGRFLAESVAKNPDILVSLVRKRARDYFLLSHSVSVALLCAFLAHRLFPEQNETIASIAVGGLLHDLGKQFIPEELLNKPGKLTKGELDFMRRHPAMGEALLVQVGVSDPLILRMVRHHHERMDGMGYPDGLKGLSIPVEAKIAAVADAFDAITSERPYKHRLPGYKGVSELIASVGKHLDSVVVRTFVNSFGMYPPGTEVELSDGRRGVVVAPGEKSILKPRVLVRKDTNGQACKKPVLVDISGERALYIKKCIPFDEEPEAV